MARTQIIHSVDGGDTDDVTHDMLILSGRDDNDDHTNGRSFETLPRTLHLHLNPYHVRSLNAQLAIQEYMALLDGGCDTSLLGDGWYIQAYTG
jgi:hypothetical protein